MYEGCNKTAIASQAAIAEALIELMKDKPYSRISVSEASPARPSTLSSPPRTMSSPSFSSENTASARRTTSAAVRP